MSHSKKADNSASGTGVLGTGAPDTSVPGTSATQKALGQLHELLATELMARIKAGDSAPALLNVARQFLRDNGIESLPAPGSHTSELFNMIQTYDLEENNLH